MSGASVIELQTGQNTLTRDCWDSMDPHRRRLTRELQRTGRRGRLCVLGAGNCNDLDLVALVSAFDDIHLVDLDGQALEFGVRQQGVEDDARIHRHGGVDFAGLTRRARENRLTAAQRVELFQEAVDALPDASVPESDVVVSTCVVSQLVQGVLKWFHEGEAGLEDAVLAVRNRHVDLLLERTARGGVAVLVMDMVSSDTAPSLQRCPGHELAALRDQLIRTHNYFHGTNPRAVERYLAERHAADVRRVELRPPWKWTLGERAFLVNALHIER